MDAVLKDGTIVTARDTYLAHVGIEDGLVASMGEHVEADLLVDVTGRYILPGAVDPHTHLELDFMDTVSSDDFYTGTVAVGRRASRPNY